MLESSLCFKKNTNLTDNSRILRLRVQNFQGISYAPEHIVTFSNLH